MPYSMRIAWKMYKKSSDSKCPRNQSRFHMLAYAATVRLNRAKKGNSSVQTPGRGPSLMNASWSRGNNQIKIVLNDRGQPVMPEASPLATNMGVLVRDGSLLPLHYTDWRYVPAHYKKKVWEEIKHPDASSAHRQMTTGSNQASPVEIDPPHQSQPEPTLLPQPNQQAGSHHQCKGLGFGVSPLSVVH
ncbi:hypothetical protein RHMOL_Rhmol03G0119100 [Rhododendron molle]|uniref:Uncharacterized protein n=6 Tax=Rhododendron molle TaxID=49168 RepID=A0ACC0PCY5_RHOML|nr:hypothetical protein RHMOL_Rhmol03G0119100 [Rhododendron molle]KAI8563556.1 hypothetical protein RHMOL_Rhmol03G0119100 [Rhododendron molle]KAI8563557.1 hypothetical protein RHMOL_Rhmol03G0119100 [Rhododendron molle]KAI8563559.1 hypothetical protein RHMOL_Rhmol03G0119100 [Rhododendron molle]KAI8563561.1 hypothetical protein RHMOL_Rhmol03G0119100 [Rhododendron molle]